MASLTIGAAGARRRATVTRASYSVLSAAESAVASGAQNRRRLTRTYQFDRSESQNSMMARTPAVTSYPDQARRTASTRSSSRPRSQRSTSGRSAGGGPEPATQSSAYRAKNPYVLRSRLRNPAATSRIAAASNRLGSQTWLDASRYRRTASAPNSRTACHGSTTLPTRLDIFRPSASSTNPFTMT